MQADPDVAQRILTRVGLPWSHPNIQLEFDKQFWDWHAEPWNDTQGLILAWCKEHFRDRSPTPYSVGRDRYLWSSWCAVIDNTNKEIAFYFLKAQDAMLFKLRWGGSFEV